MKKNNLLSFVAMVTLFQIATIFSVLAQDADKPPLTFGVKLGTSSSGFTNYHQVVWGKQLGFAGGVFAEYKPISLAGIEVDVNYVQEGSFKAPSGIIYPREALSTVNANYIYTYTSDIMLHTLQVPVLLNIRPPLTGNIIPRLTLGYSFDFIMNATTRNEVYITPVISGTNVDALPLSKRNKENVTSSFKSMNMGPVFGLGVDFKSDKLTYLVEVRYKVGMNSINNLGSLAINGQRDFSVNTLTVTLGIGF